MSQRTLKGFNLWDQWEIKLREIELRQLRTLTQNRAFFKQCNDVWTPHTGSYNGAELAEWIIDAYIAYTASWIRKMAEEPKGDNGKYSLVVLLRGVARHAQHITRSRFESLYLSTVSHGAPDRIRRKWIELANRDFDVYAGAGVDTMTSASVENDIDEIKVVVAPVKALADKVIVHTDKNPPVTPCTFGALTTAIDVLETKFRRYHMLIIGRQPAAYDTLDVADDLRKIWPNVAHSVSADSGQATPANVLSATTRA